MNLIVDVGNSRVKYGVATPHGEIVEMVSSGDFDEKIVEDLLSRHALSRAILSSTRGDQTSAVEAIRRIVGSCVNLDSQTPMPLGNNYATPSTLGVDRLAVAIGAREMYGRGNLLIVDVGTAITIDFVSAEGNFEGGFISAGVRLRLRALHDFTASLPLCEPSEEVVELARTTKDAITHGVMNGIKFEIEGYISTFMQKYEKLSVIFVGGDAIFFEKRIKNAIFANQELLLCGLNRILEYNAEV